MHTHTAAFQPSDTHSQPLVSFKIWGFPLRSRSNQTSRYQRRHPVSCRPPLSKCSGSQMWILPTLAMRRETQPSTTEKPVRHCQLRLWSNFHSHQSPSSAGPQITPARASTMSGPKFSTIHARSHPGHLCTQSIGSSLWCSVTAYFTRPPPKSFTSPLYRRRIHSKAIPN